MPGRQQSNVPHRSTRLHAQRRHLRFGFVRTRCARSERHRFHQRVRNHSAAGSLMTMKLLIALSIAVMIAAPEARASGPVVALERVSVATNGTQGNGDSL